MQQAPPSIKAVIRQLDAYHTNPISLVARSVVVVCCILKKGSCMQVMDLLLVVEMLVCWNVIRTCCKRQIGSTCWYHQARYLNGYWVNTGTC